MIRQSIPQDVVDFAPTVRHEDIREIESISGRPVMEALSIGVFHSALCLTGIGRDGTIAIMAGVVPRGGEGSVWMICAPSISRNARELLEGAPPFLDAMERRYGPLTNVVDERNTVHIRLLTRLGFEFGPPIENYGAAKIRVLPFKRKRHV